MRDCFLILQYLSWVISYQLIHLLSYFTLVMLFFFLLDQSQGLNSQLPSGIWLESLTTGYNNLPSWLGL